MVKSSSAKKAREFALKAHRDQKYGKYPYIYHLDAVVDILDQYGQHVQIIGYLHDIIEDTETTKSDIIKNFGKYVAECVFLTTDGPGKNRKQKKMALYKKLKESPSDHESSLIVKAADRLANIEACIMGGRESLLKMYKREHLDFKDAVYRPKLCDDIWDRIEFIINTQQTNPNNQRDNPEL